MDSTAHHETPYVRAQKRGKRPPKPTYPDPKGESALFDWIVLIVGYVVCWNLLRFIVDITPTWGLVVGMVAIVVLLCMLFREHYEETLRDRRAGLR